MVKKNVLAMGIIIPVIVLICFSAWAIPLIINYQAKLTDAGGNALNGSYRDGSLRCDISELFVGTL